MKLILKLLKKLRAESNTLGELSKKTGRSPQSLASGLYRLRKQGVKIDRFNKRTSISEHKSKSMRIVEMRREGASLDSISKDTGISKNRITSILTRQRKKGVEIPKFRAVTPQFVEKIIKLRAEGNSAAELEKKLGKPKDYLANIISRMRRRGMKIDKYPIGRPKKK